MSTKRRPGTAAAKARKASRSPPAQCMSSTIHRPMDLAGEGVKGLQPGGETAVAVGAGRTGGAGPQERRHLPRRARRRARGGSLRSGGGRAATRRPLRPAVASSCATGSKGARTSGAEPRAGRGHAGAAAEFLDEPRLPDARRGEHEQPAGASRACSASPSRRRELVVRRPRSGARRAPIASSRERSGRAATARRAEIGSAFLQLHGARSRFDRSRRSEGGRLADEHLSGAAAACKRAAMLTASPVTRPLRAGVRRVDDLAAVDADRVARARRAPAPCVRRAARSPRSVPARHGRPARRRLARAAPRRRPLPRRR